MRPPLPACLVLAGLAAVAALYAWGGDAYFALRQAAGLKPFPPFLDLHNVMAAVECWHRGVDVYATNPCDAMGRLHIYGPLWLRLPAWVGRPELTAVFGIAIALGFVVALAAVPGPVEAAMLLAAVSPDVMFALERANMDVAIFVAVVAAARLLGGGLPARVAAYGIFLGLGLLKFYPLVLLGLVVRERPRVAVGIAAAAALAGAVLVLPWAEEYRRAIANILPHPAFTGTFAARQFGQGLALMLPGHAGAAWVAAAAVAAMALAGTAAVARAVDAAPLTRWQADLFLVGAGLFLGCFVAGESVEYRAIFLLLTLPALAALGLGWAGWLVAWLMWDPVARRIAGRLLAGEGELPGLPALMLWTLRELLWWALATVLAGVAWRVLGGLTGRGRAPA